MSKKYPILMGDVVSSSGYDAKKLSTNLKKLVDETNASCEEHILSPLTITLGDEFQSIITSVPDAISVLFHLEEAVLEQKIDFKLHYVLYVGEIDTEINIEIAYEMLGKGLTEARKLLTSKKRNRKRFQFNIDHQASSKQLTRIFEVLDSIILSWKKEDFPLILDMIRNENNNEVGEMYKKTRAQIWKRRNTLMIKEYNLLKSFIKDYAGKL